MSLFLIGKDYTNAKVLQRQELYLLRDEIKRYFGNVSILSTCNRFEVYGEGKVPEIIHPLLKGAQIIDNRRDLFRHCLWVASGLASQIKGETEILSQLSHWVHRDNLSLGLEQFWKEILKEANEVRRKSALDNPQQNLATVIFGLLAKEDRALKIIIAGTGKVAELFIRNKPAWVKIDFLAHKNYKRAEALARAIRGRVLGYREMTGALIKADVLISASASPHLIFKKDYLKQVLLSRLSPLVAFDLALPRDIDNASAELKNLVLYDLENLSPVIDEFNQRVSSRLELAEYLVEERVKDYAQRSANIKAGNTFEPACAAASAGNNFFIS